MDNHKLKKNVNIQDMKCAPSKKYTNGSCFEFDSLKKIAENFNKRSDDKIDLTLSKEKLVKELDTKLSDKCSDQSCWLKLDFVKQIDDETIHYDTFRPLGPSKKYEWLSTTHINQVIEQYHRVYKDFLFLGAVPYDFDSLPFLGISNLDFDELYRNGKTKIGIIINLDEHYKNGSHWVALYFDLINNKIYFFDSVGKKPYKRIRKFINRITKYLYNKKYNQELNIDDVIKKINTVKSTSSSEINKTINSDKYIKSLLEDFDIKFNNIQHQFKDSECGVYSVNFILRLVDNEDFDSIIKNITKDEEMNLNRKIYFRNVN